MAYNQNIPQPTDRMRVSQADILENFATLYAMLNINHITAPFNTPATADEGKHLYLQMPEHAAPTTAVNEAGLYCNVGAFSGVSELFFRREGNGTSIAFTEGINASPGWTRLPSGLIVKWGNPTVSAVVAAGANVTITFPVAANIPAFTTQLWTIIVPRMDPANPVDPNVACVVTDITNPLNFIYAQWRRNNVNTSGTNQGSYIATYISLGI